MCGKQYSHPVLLNYSVGNGVRSEIVIPFRTRDRGAVSPLSSTTKGAAYLLVIPSGAA